MAIKLQAKLTVLITRIRCTYDSTQSRMINIKRDNDSTFYQILDRIYIGLTLSLNLRAVKDSTSRATVIPEYRSWNVNYRRLRLGLSRQSSYPPPPPATTAASKLTARPADTGMRR